MGKALLDANVLVGIVRDKDALHEKAVDLVERLKGEYEFWALNLVIQEVATVVSMRDGMGAAKIFYRGYKNMVDVEISLDEELENLSWKVFVGQEKKGTSFVDCANLAVIERYKLDGILTFDEFYPKDLRLG
ncbi:MAG: type II toxin-antitoxin system VapC family toxin [Candidatus Chisholmbacteria bacterium]|nr:type II toxin-antitoxin system VapC family toxin [Candidatus Chisholmbacteria bacterium]